MGGRGGKQGRPPPPDRLPFLFPLPPYLAWHDSSTFVKFIEKEKKEREGKGSGGGGFYLYAKRAEEEEEEVPFFFF